MQIFADYNILQLSPLDLNCTNDTSFLTKTTADTGNDKRFSNSSGIICIGIVTARVSSTTGGCFHKCFVCSGGGGGERVGIPVRTRTGHPSPCPSPLARSRTAGYPDPSPPCPHLQPGYPLPCPIPMTKTRTGYSPGPPPPSARTRTGTPPSSRKCHG